MSCSSKIYAATEQRDGFVSEESNLGQIDVKTFSARIQRSTNENKDTRE
jgi:hypothetical protein